MDIKNTKPIESLQVELHKGRRKGVGLFELFYLVIMGLSDGKNGLPQNENDVWKSSVINREQNSFEEYADVIWGDIVQIQLTETHIHVDELLKEIPLISAKIDAARTVEKKAEPIQMTRKRGEEELSDNQVFARRKREEAKRNAALHSVVVQLEDCMEKAYMELIKEYNLIKETMDAARMVCERVMKHADQRIDIYWHVAYLARKNKENMPMVAPGLNPPKAEKIFSDQHTGYTEVIEEVLEKYAKDIAEIRLHRVDRKEEVV